MTENGKEGVTVSLLLAEAEKRLRVAGVPDPETDARALVFHCFDLTLTQYLLRKEEPLAEDEDTCRRTAWLGEALERRSCRVPLQHILGCAPFMGLLFDVNEHVLIPRADTEILVLTALELVRKLQKEESGKPGPDVLDLCTGSGCIAVSMKKECPSIRCSACDISPEALAVASGNAGRHGAQIEFVQSDLLSAFPEEKQFDLIVSNPPYIASDEIETLQEEVRTYDPRLALDGGADGLDFYRRICAQSSRHIDAGGYLAFEIGADQGAEVAAVMRKTGFEDIGLRKDLAGLDRVVWGRRRME